MAEALGRARPDDPRTAAESQVVSRDRVYSYREKQRLLNYSIRLIVERAIVEGTLGTTSPYYGLSLEAYRALYPLE